MKPKKMANEQQIRVLVADDHPVVRHGIMANLKPEGDITVVAEAGDGGKALALIKEHLPDVVMLDLRMPGMDGLDVIAQLSESKLPSKVIIMTTFDSEEDVQRSMKAGARGYLLKGASREQIRCAIHAAASGGIIFAAQPAARMLACFTATAAPPPPFPQLTSRERQVLGLLAQGRANTAIATRLSLSPKTVRNHVSSILAKLQVTDRAQAIIQARDAGLGQISVGGDHGEATRLQTAWSRGQVVSRGEPLDGHGNRVVGRLPWEDTVRR